MTCCDSAPRKDKEAKVATAKTMWVPAVNNHGGLGEWRFTEVTDPWDTKSLFAGALEGETTIYG